MTTANNNTASIAEMEAIIKEVTNETNAEVIAPVADNKTSKAQWQWRDSHADHYVYMARNGKISRAKFNLANPAKDEYATINQKNTEAGNVVYTMAAFAKDLKNIATTGKSGDMVVFYLPEDNAIRTWSCLGALKKGLSTPFTEQTLAKTTEYKGEAYVKATAIVMKYLKVAQENGLFINVNTLDDIWCTKLENGRDVPFQLAKGRPVVEFENGVTTVAGITMTAQYHINGNRQLGIRNMGGNQKNRQVVVLKDATKSRTTKRAQTVMTLMYHDTEAVSNSIIDQKIAAFSKAQEAAA